MNKAELVSAIAEKAGISKVDAHKALDAFVSVTVDQLKVNDKISILGFGTFMVSERSARTGINPRTKEKVSIPAKKVAKFKASKGFEL
ncbi:MAG: HU family DNA-binding protein [Bacteroidales bacterium]|nr:HU family DNA-binding protein [Candidatus Colimorpha onthohippi]